MASEHNLDGIDRQIIDFLKKDAKMSLKVIAEKVGKTEATVRRRVKALEDKGIISGYTILLPTEERKIKVFIRLDPDLSKTSEIADTMYEFANVQHVYFMSGECGIWVRANFTDINELNLFLKDKVGKIEGIKKIINCIILNERQKKFD